MLQNSDGETEIVLGNKRLLGIFFVVVILLGLAFAGGYKVGQGSRKASLAAAVPDATAAASNTGTGGETHGFAGDAPSTPASAANDAAAQDTTSSNTAAPAEPDAQQQTTPPLGSPRQTAPALPPAPEKHLTPKPKAPEESEPVANAYTPQAGQTFLQVAAVSRDEAIAVADVLRKKGFHAHAVPRPGGGKLYRVIIGPTHDASDLNTTRGALRSAGFREIIVQHY